MAKNYDAPIELRPLEKKFNDFVQYNGFERYRIFDDWLTYMIHGFSPGAPPLKNWNYKPEHNKFFYELYAEWILIMDKMINIHGWYDALGHLYQTVITSKKGQQYSGQFFTPASIAEIMTQTLNVDKKQGLRVSDPTCGSGGLLLSFHASNPGNFLFGEDISSTCCKMSVCNFVVHGCVGEIVCHNSLLPDSFTQGWWINENLYKTGKIGVREIKKEHSYVWNVWQQKLVENQTQINTPK